MSKNSSDENLIVCPVSGWFFRRFGLMTALMAGLALFFYYDGAVGYPKENFNADLFDAFDAGRNGTDLEEVTAAIPNLGSRPEDRVEIERAFNAAAAGTSWAVYAAGRHLAESEPKRHSEAAIRQQFIFAWVLGGLTVVMLGFLLTQRNRQLRAGADWLETDKGERIAFSAITGADFTRWDRGIAVLEITDDDGEDRRIRIDDYKFSGAKSILVRIREAWPGIVAENWPDFSTESLAAESESEGEKSDGN